MKENCANILNKQIPWKANPVQCGTRESRKPE
jgi:hypothetical protein